MKVVIESFISSLKVTESGVKSPHTPRIPRHKKIKTYTEAKNDLFRRLAPLKATRRKMIIQKAQRIIAPKSTISHRINRIPQKPTRANRNVRKR